MTNNLLAVLLVAIGMLGLHFQVEYSGWVLLLGGIIVTCCEWGYNDKR